LLVLLMLLLLLLLQPKFAEGSGRRIGGAAHSCGRGMVGGLWLLQIKFS